MNDGIERTFKFGLLEQEVEVPFEEMAGSISPFTGKDLRRVQFDFDVSAEKSSEVVEVLNAARNIDNPLIGEGSHWTVSSSSYSYEEGSGVHHHHVELEEAEKPLKAERLEMLGLSLTPLRYEEDTNDDAVVITCIVACDTDDDRLEQAVRDERPSKEYFDVVRVGVSDQPMRFRFGRCLWQEKDSQRLHLIRLVADSDDPRDGGAFARIHQPELGLAQRKIAALEAVTDELMWPDPVHRSTPCESPGLVCGEYRS